MQLKTEGLIMKEQAIGESDRLVTVLTRDRGVLRAFARKAKNMKDRKNSATQLLCYSRLNIYEGRDKYIINDAFPIEVFFELRQSISKLSLAQYFCELAAELTPEGTESSEYLRVVLNALHFLCKTDKPEMILKAIAEMRLLSCSGYMPNLVSCADCGAYEADRMYLLIQEGVLFCENCYIKTSAPSAGMGRAALKGMRHIIYSDFEKLFSFSLKVPAQKELSAASEAYALGVLQRRPQTLDFYHAVK